MFRKIRNNFIRRSSRRGEYSPAVEGIRRAGSGLTVLGLLLSTAGCTHQPDDLNIWVKKTLASNRSFVAEIEPPPEIEIKIYDVGHLRDPFLSRAEKTNKKDKARPAPPISRPPEFLESYKLADLKLVGVLIGKGKSDALIEDPEGQVHAVKVGDHMGESFGRVHKIFDNGLDLYEQVLNENRQWVLRITRMYIESE